MGLRLVGGSAKGQKLKGPKQSGIRPAAARVRKSIFEILGDLQGKLVLDLFAGTGAMGMEALSKGAQKVTFVDSNPHAIQLLFHNLKKTNFIAKSFVLKCKALASIGRLHRHKQCFDLIFIDPPYDKGLIEPIFRRLQDFPILAPDGMILCEHSPRESFDFLGGLQLLKERKYGQTIVSFFQWRQKA